MQTLDSRVEGVISGSPAQQIGLQYGDVLASIDGKQPFSRVEAFAALRENGRHHVKWRRAQSVLEGNFTVNDQSSGVVMYYDIAQSAVQEVEQIAADGRQYVMLCSQFGAPAWQAAGVPENVTLYPVQSVYFGGNIGAAGLLTIADFKQALQQYSGQYDAVLLPAIAFNDNDKDLTGASLYDWSQELTQEIILC